MVSLVSESALKQAKEWARPSRFWLRTASRPLGSRQLNKRIPLLKTYVRKRLNSSSSQVSRRKLRRNAADQPLLICIFIASNLAVKYLFLASSKIDDRPCSHQLSFLYAVNYLCQKLEFK